MKKTLGFALCGSFCTLKPVLAQLERLVRDYTVIPIFSENTMQTDTRFGPAAQFVSAVTGLCGAEPLHSLPQVEPLGPKKLLDLLVIAPCTGNTLGKLAGGIADSTVTFACKAHLRNSRPVVLAVSTNDALAASAENIGKLLVRKHYYFVPFGQDDWRNKPCSMVAHMELLPETVEEALSGQQLQPLLRNY